MTVTKVRWRREADKRTPAESLPLAHAGKKNRLLLIALGLTACLIVTAYAGMYLFFELDGIAPGIHVAAIDASGMSKDELKAALRQKTAHAVTIGFAGAERKQTFGDLGIKPDIEAAVATAWSYGHGLNVPKAAYQRYISAQANQDESVAIAYDQKKWDALLTGIRKVTDVKPQDARIVMGNAGFPRIIPEKSGYAVDERQIKATLSDAFNTGKDTVVLQTKEIAPKLTKEEIESWKLDHQLARFATSYASSASARKSNITAAAKKITGTLLLPGQVFSFNETVGRRTAAGGFQEAPVYLNGKVGKGIGGGICQVATTLYNAVLRSGLKIVERHNHSLLVHYVPPGLDATVDYGSSDLRFSNPYKTPVYVNYRADGSHLSAAIFGAGDGRTYQIESRKLSTKPFDIITKHVKSKAEMQPKQSGMDGVTAVAYRYVYKDGQLLEKENLGVSAYKSLSRIHYVLDTPKPTATALVLGH